MTFPNDQRCCFEPDKSRIFEESLWCFKSARTKSHWTCWATHWCIGHRHTFHARGLENVGSSSHFLRSSLLNSASDNYKCRAALWRSATRLGGGAGVKICSSKHCAKSRNFRQQLREKCQRIDNSEPKGRCKILVLHNEQSLPLPNVTSLDIAPFSCRVLSILLWKFCSHCNSCRVWNRSFLCFNTDWCMDLQKLENKPLPVSVCWAICNSLFDGVFLGEVVQLTSAAALRPFVIKITGPLIRVVGDRFPAEVKAAILKTLG